MNYAENFLRDKLGSNANKEELQNYLINHTTIVKKYLRESVNISDILLEESLNLGDNMEYMVNIMIKIIYPLMRKLYLILRSYLTYILN